MSVPFTSQELADFQQIVNLTRPLVGQVRACPDCGKPQHYTGTEYGWAHDALPAMWDCAGEHVRANKTSERGA